MSLRFFFHFNSCMQPAPCRLRQAQGGCIDNDNNLDSGRRKPHLIVGQTHPFRRDFSYNPPRLALSAFSKSHCKGWIAATIFGA